MKKLLFILIVITGCGTFHQPYVSSKYSNWSESFPDSDKEIIHSLFLVGDTGEIDDCEAKTNAVVEAVREDIADETVETSLVFLGDNIYPHGLPHKKSPDRAAAEDIIIAQLDCAKAHEGKTYFIPGNHDWNKHKPGGRESILRQEKYIENYYKDSKQVKFYPNNACGDPKVVKINKDLVYIFIDSQWWLQDWSKEKKMNQGCDVTSRADLLNRMEELMWDHKNDEIVILMHHPIKTEGTHGGHFSFRQHVFPLTEAKDKLWIPLPIIGSAYSAYRKVTGDKQDATNIYNQELTQGLDKLVKKLRVNAIIASGHDHGLQYFDGDKIKYVVSGAGGKIDYVKSGGEASYSRSARGYAKINFHEDFEKWIEYYVVDPLTNATTLEFRAQLRKPRPGTVEEDIEYPTVTKMTQAIAANEKFAAGPIKQFFLGSQYRDIWTTPVEAEVINLETKFGGLTPIKKGGGFASNSLRMEKKDGKHYILRSIKKDYTKLVPPDFSNLKLVEVLADQNSASHPYCALAIPHLSKAADVYYTNPKLVYLSHQKALGNYNSQFPEELYLLEERPDGNWEDAEQFGKAKEIIGYVDLLEKLRKKKNHHIDQEWVLKSRMFDIFLHDWDRHDDQWRWIKAEELNRTIYRPIPRDRDQAFFRFKGLIPWYLSTFVQKNFKTIKEDCKDVHQQSFNAKHFDRYFLHELEWKEWEAVIVELQAKLTDAAIDEAMSYFPKEVLKLNDDEELAALLKARKRNLMKMGRQLYDFLSKEVEITATDNDDDVLILRNEDGSVQVTIVIDSKEHGLITKYDRTFYSNETQEVRIYGLRGEDSFTMTGANNNAIRIRVIGGEEDDIVLNNTEGNRFYIYDEPDGMEVEGPVSDKRSTALSVNEYDRNGFAYDSSFPMLTFGNTVDDGWWVGGSMTWTKQAWRKSPYKSSQGFSFSAAPGSRDAYQIGYSGHFPDALGKLDFAPSATLSYPRYENYFGLGNDSAYDPSTAIEYNWVRMQDIDIHPRFRANLGKSAKLYFGPLYRSRHIRNTEGRVSEDELLGFTPDELDRRSYWGGDVLYSLGAVDSKIFPTNGFKLNASATHLREPSKKERVTVLSASAQFYLRLLNRPKLVFATQLGYQRSYGDLQFYQYSDLGNNQGLRGYRNERFRGQTAFYLNLDLRAKLFKWNNTILPMDIGILGGYDYGRVGLANSNADDWHNSQTIGIWFELLGALTVQPYYSFNEEQNTFSLRVGFNF